MRPADLQGILPSSGKQDFIAVLLENLPEEQQAFLVVLDEQDSFSSCFCVRRLHAKKG